MKNRPTQERAKMNHSDMPEVRLRIGADESHTVLCHCGQTYPRLPAGGLDFLQGCELPDFDLDEDDFRRRAILEQEAEGIAGRMDNLIIPIIRRYTFWAGKTFGGDNGLASAIDFR